MNLSPQDGSLVAELVGSENSSTFQCDVFSNSSGRLLQITTAWGLRNFRSSGNNIFLADPLESEGVLLIDGDLQPPGSFSSTFRNRLLILNFIEDFDGVELVCGSGANIGIVGFDLRVYSKSERCP